MKKIFIIILFYGLPVICIGSDKLKNIQFELIKETIKFLASDDSLYDIKTEIECDDIGDYQCLTNYCDANGIIKGSNRVNEWKDVKLTSKVELKELINKILNEVTLNKNYRKELPTYTDYVDFMTKLAADFNENSEGGLPGSVEISNSDNLEPQEDVMGIEKRSVDVLGILGILFGLTACLIAVYCFNRVKTLRKLNIGSIAQEERINTIIKELSTLKLQLDIKSDKQSNLIIFNKLDELETRLKLTENKSADTNNVNIKKSNKEEFDLINKTKKFAKIPDLTRGFSNMVLVDLQNGEQIYEIQVDDNAATFRITNDLDAQKYALSDFNYYLATACIFVNQPVKGSRIQTNKDGVLKKDSQNWIIETKAVIEFK